LPDALPFAASRLDFVLRFRPHVLHIASIASTSTGQILFDILSNTERLARWPPQPDEPQNEPNFAVLEEPANPPGNANAVALELFRRASDAFQLLSIERGNFFTWLLNAIPIDVSDSLPNFHSLPTRELFTALHDKFGILFPADLDELRTRLEIPFSFQTTVQSHISSFDRVFCAFHSQGINFQDHQKFAALMKSFSSCSSFHRCIDIYEASHPFVTDQTYESLCKTFSNFNLARIMPLSSSSAAAISSHVTDTATAETVRVLAGQVAELKDLLAKKSSTTKKNKKKYCHTHGLGFHDGAHCNNPGPAHVSHATLSNQLGGSTSGTKFN
jgi:hypothetical protein